MIGKIIKWVVVVIIIITILSYIGIAEISLGESDNETGGFKVVPEEDDEDEKILSGIIDNINFFHVTFLTIVFLFIISRILKRYECKVFGHRWQSWNEVARQFDIPESDRKQKFCVNCSKVIDGNTRTNKFRRISISIVIVILLIAVTLIPFITYAEGDIKTSTTQDIELQSTGTEINDWYDLDDVRNNLSGDYYLENNLDQYTDGYSDVAGPNANNENGFDPIGPSTSSPFSGTFDGNNHTISDLFIDRTGTDNVGLFGVLGNGGELTNLRLEDVDVSGNNKAGSLLGWSYGAENLIENIYATGDVSGSDHVGGLVGSQSSAETRSSIANVDVSGSYRVGGFVGFNYDDGEIHNSTALGNVSGGDRTGGFAGQHSFSDSMAYIYNSYSTGNVTGSTDVGGFVGKYGKASVYNSYWNNETSGKEYQFDPYINGTARPRTTKNMTYEHTTAKDTFYDYNDTVWNLGNHDYIEDHQGNTGYPALKSVDNIEVTTGAASDIYSSQATLYGELTDKSTPENVTALFEYREQGESTWSNQSTTVTLTQEQTYDITVTGLNPGITYEYRAYANTTSVTDTGLINSFTTATTDPTIQTNDVYNVDSTSATFEGEITYDGGHDSLTVYFEYRENWTSTWTTTASTTVSTETTYTIDETGLSEGTHYEFRAATDYDDGATVSTAYGDSQNYTTHPYAETLHATNIQKTQANLNMDLHNQNWTCTVYFEYKRSIDTAWSTTPSTSLDSGEYTQTISDLDKSTSYDFRAIVEYESSRGEGDTLIFETLSDEDTVTLEIYITDGGAVEEPGVGTFQFSPGEEVDLNATADDNFTFAEWTGDTGNISDRYAASTTITMNGDYSITANFDEQETTTIIDDDDDTTDDGGLFDFNLGLPDIDPLWIILPVLGIGAYLIYKKYISGGK